MCCTVREFFLEKGSSGELFIGLTFFFLKRVLHIAWLIHKKCLEITGEE